MVNEKDRLTDAQIYNLILEPGFSTANRITDISGRGVGMDVVKEGIDNLRGQLTIESSIGVGSKFTIKIPLTLAIIDGMLVKANGEKYVIPTTAVQKAFRPDRENCFTVEGKGQMITDKSGLLPVIRLNRILGETTSVSRAVLDLKYERADMAARQMMLAVTVGMINLFFKLKFILLLLKRSSFVFQCNANQMNRIVVTEFVLFAFPGSAFNYLAQLFFFHRFFQGGKEFRADP